MGMSQGSPKVRKNPGGMVVNVIIRVFSLSCHQFVLVTSLSKAFEIFSFSGSPPVHFHDSPPRFREHRFQSHSYFLPTSKLRLRKSLRQTLSHLKKFCLERVCAILTQSPDRKDVLHFRFPSTLRTRPYSVMRRPSYGCWSPSNNMWTLTTMSVGFYWCSNLSVNK